MDQGKASDELSKSTRRRKLTPTKLASWASTSQAQLVPDPATPGLQLHIGALLSDGGQGAKSWQYRFTWAGKRQKLTLGRFPNVGQEQARTLAEKARAFIEQGIDPRRAGLRSNRHAAPVGSPSGDSHSIETLVDEYMEKFVETQRKRPEYVRRILDVEILKRWNGRDARTIKPRDVIALLDDIVARGSPVQANRVAAVLAQMFKYGVHRQIVESSPVQLLFKPGGKETPRSRALSDQELGALLRGLDEIFQRAPRTAAVIRVALHTAARRGEISGARWADIDLKGGTWRIPAEDAKEGVECFNALTPKAVEIFKGLKKSAGKSRWVFPDEEGNGPLDPRLVTRSIARHQSLLVEIGVSPFTLHDIRRTVRTGLAKLGVLPHIAERVLNHAQPGIAGVYDRYAYLPEKRDALDKWAAHLAALEATHEPNQDR